MEQLKELEANVLFLHKELVSVAINIVALADNFI